MAIAVDASSAAGVSQTNSATLTLATGSFTPPSGSVILASWQGNSATANPTAPTIANSGGLTFTAVNIRTSADTGGAHGQAAMWYAIVSTSPGAMTVTVTNNAASGSRQARLRVLVLTGADTTTPIASSGEGTDSGGALDTLSYTSTVANSVGFASVSDWDVSSTTFTAASGTTIDDSQSVGASINCATLKQTTPTTSGSTISLGLTSPTSTQWNYVWAEIRPASTSGTSASAANTAASVTSSSAQSSVKPSASATSVAPAAQGAVGSVKGVASLAGTGASAQSALGGVGPAAGGTGTSAGAQGAVNGVRGAASLGSATASAPSAAAGAGSLAGGPGVSGSALGTSNQVQGTASSSGTTASTPSPGLSGSTSAGAPGVGAGVQSVATPINVRAGMAGVAPSAVNGTATNGVAAAAGLAGVAIGVPASAPGTASGIGASGVGASAQVPGAGAGASSGVSGVGVSAPTPSPSAGASAQTPSSGAGAQTPGSGVTASSGASGVGAGAQLLSSGVKPSSGLGGVGADAQLPSSGIGSSGGASGASAGALGVGSGFSFPVGTGGVGASAPGAGVGSGLPAGTGGVGAGALGAGTGSSSLAGTSGVGVGAGASTSGVGASGGAGGVGAGAQTPSSGVGASVGTSGAGASSPNGDAETPVAVDTFWNGSPPAWTGSDDDAPLAVGMAFSVLVSGQCTGVRFHTNTTESGTVVAQLHTNTGTLLASKNGPTNPTAGSYDITFDTPQTLNTSTIYVVSIWHPEGRYSYTTNPSQFQADFTSPGGTLFTSDQGGYGPGRFVYGASAGALPNGNSQTWYGAEPIFSTVSAGTNASAANAPVTGQSNGVGSNVTAGGVGSTGAAASASNATISSANNATASAGLASTAVLGITAAVNSSSGTTYETLFGGSPPAFTGSDDDPSPLTLGLAFSVLSSGSLAGVEVSTATTETGTWVALLYDNAGNQLATKNGPTNPGAGTYRVFFDTPVTVNTGTIYIVAVFHPQGRYSYKLSQFTSDYTSPGGHLYTTDQGAYGPGRFIGGASPAYPNGNSQTWYGMEPLFVADAAVTQVNPTTAGASGAAQTASVGHAALAGTGAVNATVPYDASGAELSASLESQAPVDVAASAIDASVSSASNIVVAAGMAGTGAASASPSASLGSPAGAGGVAASGLGETGAVKGASGVSGVAVGALTPNVTVPGATSVNAGTAGVTGSALSATPSSAQGVPATTGGAGASASDAVASVKARAGTAGVGANSPLGDSVEAGDANISAGTAGVTAAARDASASSPTFALVETANAIVSALMASVVTTELAPGAFPNFTVLDLSNFTGRPVASYTNTAYVSQALAEARLLFKLATCRSTYPTTVDEAQLAEYAILSLADSIYLASAYTTTLASPFQSETIGSYTYTKTSASVGSFATRIAAGQPTGDMWFDLAVRSLGVCETGLASSALQVFTDDLVWEEDRATGRLRVLGPEDYNRVDYLWGIESGVMHDPVGEW